MSDLSGMYRSECASCKALRARVAELEGSRVAFETAMVAECERLIADRDRWKDEAMAWRAWHDDESDRGTGWLMELTTNVDKARAANDAARAANGEVEQ